MDNERQKTDLQLLIDRLNRRLARMGTPAEKTDRGLYPIQYTGADLSAYIADLETELASM